MLLATSQQMREFDANAIKLGIPGIVLMENAARSVFEVCAGLDAYKSKTAVVLCGTGNNGGDGFALARHMANDGADVTITIIGDTAKLKGDAKTNYDICVNTGIKIVNGLPQGLTSCPLIIDALLGTGVSGELRGDMAGVVSFINGLRANGAFVVAVDCPTGGNPDNGKVAGECVKADVTIALGLVKTGLLLYPLAEYAGRLETGQIGANFANVDTGFYALDDSSASRLIPRRRERSHKGTYGKVALVAGSRGMAGAAAYCAKAAYAAGCGYVNACVPDGIVPLIQQLAPQAVITPLAEKDGRVFEYSAELALEKINASTVCLIGPGLGNTPETAAFVREIVINAQKPLIIDADALNALAGNAEILKKAKHTPILTPHPLEMSRLTGLSPDYILDNALEAAMEFSEKYGVVTVLKDATTLISGNGKTFINKCGCPALAKAGSGDVLAGLIAGFAAQRADALEAAALGVFVHGRCGVYAAGKYGEYSVTSEALVESAGAVIADIQKRLQS